MLDKFDGVAGFIYILTLDFVTLCLFLALLPHHTILSVIVAILGSGYTIYIERQLTLVRSEYELVEPVLRTQCES